MKQIIRRLILQVYYDVLKQNKNKSTYFCPTRRKIIYLRVTFSPVVPAPTSSLGVSPTSIVNMTIFGVIVDILLLKHNV